MTPSEERSAPGTPAPAFLSPAPLRGNPRESVLSIPWREFGNTKTRTSVLVVLAALLPGILRGQAVDSPPTPETHLPELLAGPREPVTSAALMGVVRNPNQHGRGIEAEVSIGRALPVLRRSKLAGRGPVVAGLEAAAYARFGLQVLQREMVATDWFFAVPVVWHLSSGWLRFRYFHTSSHLGDEYARRFDDPGVNFSRDAVEILHFRRLQEGVGGYAGARWAYTVHPEDSERWVLRAGGQMEGPEKNSPFRPFLAADVEWDQSAGSKPRVEMRMGTTVRAIGRLEGVRFSLAVLTGPSPLGQFNGISTTQVGLTLTKGH